MIKNNEQTHERNANDSERGVSHEALKGLTKQSCNSVIIYYCWMRQSLGRTMFHVVQVFFLYSRVNFEINTVK
jgi:hypothetical protein